MSWGGIGAPGSLLNRRVSIKPDRFNANTKDEKFEPVSRIHEGLVDILQVGRISPDCFYYVMELADDQVSGQRIDPATYQPRTLESEVVAKGRLPVLECIEIGIRLCQTLAFIHDQGLIHRDVKPSNVIFIDGQPKLADIGLIADVRDAKTYVGTTGFIPPEGPNSPQADLYSLGKLLYEISTGQDRNDFPTLPDQTGFSDDFLELNEVLLKSCHPDLSERYASARAMESDLKLIADGRSVRRLHQLETTLKRMQRWGAVAAVILLVCGAFYYEWNQRAQQAREETERLLGGKIAQGTTLLRNGNLLGSLPSFVEAWQLEGRKRESDSNHRLRIGSILAACPVLRTNWHLPGRPLRSCRVHGDKVLLTTQYQYWQVFDLHTGQALSKPIGSKDRPSMAVFTPDGGAVLVANFEESAQVIDWKTGEILVNMPHPCPLYSAAMSEDGQHIITGCADGAVYLWDYQGRLQGTLEGHRGHVRGVQLNANGSLAVTTSEDKTARVWDIASATCRHVLRHRNWVYCAAISPDERFIATACYDNSVTPGQRRPVKKSNCRRRNSAPSSKVEFTHQGTPHRWLDGAVRLWDRRSHQPVTFNHTLQHSTKLMDASMSSDGQVGRGRRRRNGDDLGFRRPARAAKPG
ncbi:MAG: protein kinase [Verrucomicrobiota bacterium]